MKTKAATDGFEDTPNGWRRVKRVPGVLRRAAWLVAWPFARLWRVLRGPKASE